METTDNQAREWLSVHHSPRQTTVTCSMQDGVLSVRWTVKTFASQIGEGVKQARSGARRAMAELREAAGQ